MPTTAKVVTAPMLDALNRTAAKKHYNRQITDEAIASLDPNGFHIIDPVMIHEHAGGEPVAPHLRCTVLMKFKDSQEPQYTTLDIPFDVFDTLPSADILSEA